MSGQKIIDGLRELIEFVEGDASKGGCFRASAAGYVVTGSDTSRGRFTFTEVAPIGMFGWSGPAREKDYGI